MIVSSSETVKSADVGTFAALEKVPSAGGGTFSPLEKVPSADVVNSSCNNVACLCVSDSLSEAEAVAALERSLASFGNRFGYGRARYRL